MKQKKIRNIGFYHGTDILDEFDFAVKLGTGCSFEHLRSNFSFVILPRIIPAQQLPMPEKAPLWKDAKKYSTCDGWIILRNISREKWVKYYVSKEENKIEKKTMVKLLKIRAMLERL